MNNDWHEHGSAGGHWIVAIVVMVLFWGAVAAIVIALLHNRDHPHHDRAQAPNDIPATTSAERILHDRFARGEIDEDEYTRRHDLLKERSR